MSSIDSYNFKGKRALIRVDFNVPLNDKLQVTDSTRISAATPTIAKIIKDGGSVVLMSHLGRPKNGPEDKFSLKHIIKSLEEQIKSPVKFVADCIGEKALEASSNLKPGEVLLLENLRFYKEETAGDEEFAKELSKHGNVYVNDAFGTAHRAHASTTIIAKFMNEKLFGYLMEAEVANGLRVLQSAEHPYTAIIGGAKVSSKIDVITHLLDKIDNLIIGGGMAFTFFKAQGGSIGSSLVEDEYLETAKKILSLAKEKGVNVMLPEDSVIADAFSNDAHIKVVSSMEIEAGWMGLDVGPKAIETYRDVISKSKTILWNGPLGVFEMENFSLGTKSLGEMIAQSSAYSLVGGGDSVAAVKKFNLSDEVSYVSTGGGALLELLEGKTLPGVAAIQ
ncbi:MAG TPA: phosphoglycerate kinase [Flavobacteriales bacterium]|nr:phosphoglycerate kinase [Flavobacteriales bacterium]